MSDFPPSEHNNAGSRLPDKPFAHLPLTFLLKPLLITGKAMNHYGLGASNTSVFLVPKPEFERLWEALPEGRLTTAENERGVRLGTYDFYGKILGFSYYELEIEAQEEYDYIVLHDEFLLFLNTLTLIRDPENQQARQNALVLLEKLGVWPPGQIPLAAMVSENADDLDATFHEVSDITVTRLSPEMLTLLVQHGCTITEQEPAHLLVTFPEQTQRQPLLPPTAIERFRLLLPDGLELRHEVDRAREMSLLSVVL